MLAPLFGAYELRLADAHMPKGEIEESLAKVEIDPLAVPIAQGFQLLHSCVAAIHLSGTVVRQVQLDN